MLCYLVERQLAGLQGGYGCLDAAGAVAGSHLTGDSGAGGTGGTIRRLPLGDIRHLVDKHMYNLQKEQMVLHN